MKTLALSCGDINGIGPEIILKTVKRLENKYRFILPCPVNVLEEAMAKCNIAVDYSVSETPDFTSHNLIVIDIPVNNFNPGKPTADSGVIAFLSIQQSFEYVQKGVADAIVTAPISKKALGLAGIGFPGHTEMFQQWTNTEYPLMTFLSENLKCALVTIHEPVSKVSSLLTAERLKFVITNFLLSIKRDLGIHQPRIAVLGLNPHAGEEGRIGKEEIDIITPVIKQYNSDEISGPFVPDAFFGNGTYKNYDGFVAMYHDQGLIPFKLLNFNTGVNFTAGLPIIRTSPDHGTAFDIAYQNIADESSFLEAVKWASIIFENRMKYGKNP